MSAKNLVESFMFFFSSRGRHTIYWRDWSSDVCSSDLPLRIGRAASVHRLKMGFEFRVEIDVAGLAVFRVGVRADEIGRASCRERVKISVGARKLNEHKQEQSN